MINLRSLFTFITVLIMSVAALAQTYNPQLTYHGRILDTASGNAPVTGSVMFLMQIVHPDVPTCILYQETQSQNLTATDGNFTLTVNGGLSTIPVPMTNTFAEVFITDPARTINCINGGTAPGTANARKLNVFFVPPGGSTYEPLPSQAINYTPLAIEALNTNAVGGFGATSLLRVVELDAFGVATNYAVPAITRDLYEELDRTIKGQSSYYISSQGTVANFSNPLQGEVTGVQSATVVSRLFNRPLSTGGSTFTGGEVMFYDGASWIAKPGIAGTVQTINSANSYLSVTGNAPSNNPTIDALLTINVGTTANTVAAGNDSRITGAFQAATPLAGDVTGLVSATVVSSVGGKTATQVSQSVSDTLAATAAATNSTIVKRDGSGNVAVNTLSATNTSTRNVLFYNAANTFYATVLAPSGLATSYTLTLPNTAPVSGYVLGTNGSGVTAWVNPTDGSVTNVSATAPLSSTGGQTPVISISRANTGVDGYLAAADFLIFNNKVASVTVTAPITLGGTSSTPLIGLQDSGVSAATYTKVTVDAKGIVTSGTTLIASDIPNLDASIITTGTLPIARGGTGTGVASASGYLFVDASGTGYQSTVCAANEVPYFTGAVWTCRTVSSANSSSTIVTRDANGDFTANNITTVQDMTVQRNLRIQNALSNYIGLTTPVGTSSYDIVLPNNTVPPTVGQVLQVSAATSSTVATTWVGVLTDVLAPNYIIVGNASGTASAVAMVGDATINSTGDLQLVSVGPNITSGSQYTKVTVDGKGRVTSGTQLDFSDVATALGYSPVSSVSATTPLNLTGSASNPVIGLDNSGVTAGTYGSSSTITNFVVDVWGRITSAVDVALRPASTTENGVVQIGANITVDSSGTISLNNGNITGALGYTPVNRAGDVMTGDLTAPNFSATNSVAIGTASAAASAMLDVSSTTRGFLMPRLTTAQRNAVSGPAQGLQIYNSDTNKIEYYDAVLGSWETITTTNSAITSLNGSVSPTQTFAVTQTGTAFAINTANGVHTFSIPLASAAGVTAGLISNTEFQTFQDKVTSVSGVAGEIVITGGVSSPVVGLATTGIASGTYGAVNAVPYFTVDIFGRITSAGAFAYQDATAGQKGIVQIGNNITVTAGTISVTSANVIAAMGTLGGDVSGTLDATVVQTVGGRTAAEIASSVAETQAATDLNSSGTIVKRDANGNFTANNITTVQDMTVQRNLRVQNGMANYIGITTPIATPSYDIVLPNNGTVPNIGQVLAVFAATSSTIATNWINALTDSLAPGYIFVGNVSGTASGVAMIGDTTIDSTGNVQLVSVGPGVTSGTEYTKVTVDGKGRVTSGAQLNNADVVAGLGYVPMNTVSSTSPITLSGGASNPIIGFENSGVTAASYGAANAIPYFTVDIFGRITSAGTQAYQDATAGQKGIVQVGANITVNAGTISITSQNVIAAMGTLGGDVSGTLDNTVVMTVGGKTAAQISQSVSDTIDATSNNSSGTIVRRDNNGDFTANNITAAQNMTIQQNLRLQNALLNTVQIAAPLGTTDYNLVLPSNTVSATAGQTLGVASATGNTIFTRWFNTLTDSLAPGYIFVGNVSGTASGVAMIGDTTIDSTGNVQLISVGPGVTSGTEYTKVTVDGKGRVTSGAQLNNADVVAGLGYVPVNTVSATTPLNLTGSASNPVIGLDNSGVTAASYGTSSTIATFLVDVWGRITSAASVALRPASTTENGVVQIGANITVDSSGTISLNNGNITGALGYTPVNRAGDVMTGALTAPEFSATNSVAIGTASAAASAMLDVSSTTKGLLIPRLTTAERNAVSGPAQGLQIYNTTTNKLEYYDAATSSWETVATANTAITSLNGSVSPTQTFAVTQTGTAFAINTLNGVHTFSIPLASAAGVTAGLISNTEFQTFQDKVTSVSGVAGEIVITGGVSSPVVGLATTGIASGTYGAVNAVPYFTVDIFGRISSAGAFAYQDATAGQKGIVQIGSNITVTAGTISVTSANVIAAMGTLGGDVSGTLDNTVVMTVGGRTAAEIASSVAETQAATDLNSSGTIVKRDANGNFTANNITTVQDMTVQRNLRVQNGMTNYIGITTPIATPSYDIVLPSNNTAPDVGQVLSVFAATSSTVAMYWRNALTDSLAPGYVFVGNASGTASGMAVTGDATMSDSGNLQLISVGAGVTSGTQYTKVTVDGKGRVTSGAQLNNADVVAGLGYEPMNTVSTTTPITLTGGASNPTIGLANSGVAAASYGTSSTITTFLVDVWGRITSAADVALRPASTTETGVVQVGANISVSASGTISLSNGNITGALGYTPVNRAGDTMTGALTAPAFSATNSMAIGTASADVSAALDVSSTTKGVLIPRVTTAQRNAISSPAHGLQVYNISNNKFEYYDTSLSAWETVATASTAITSLNGSVSPTQTFAVGTTGTSLNIQTANGVHTFNIPNAVTVGVTGGVISNTEFQTFQDKVTSVSAAAGQIVITGGVSSPVVGLAPTTVASGSYGGVAAIPMIAIDQFGRITSAATTVYQDATAGQKGIVQVGSNITVTTGTISLTSGNVIGALGYTPFDSASATLTGDVNGTLYANTVDFVGGRTAAQVASSVAETLAATHLNSSGTIVKRDANGDFTANNITTVQDMTVQRNLRVQNGMTNYIGITTPIATPSYDIVLPNNGVVPIAGYVLSVASANSSTITTQWVENVDELPMGYIYVGNASGTASGVAMIGDATIDYTGNLQLVSVGAGVTSGTQYTKVTVDGKGRVTSGGQLSNADVNAGLGYVPLASVSSTAPITISGGASNPVIGLANSGVTASTYGTSSTVPTFTVDIFGRISAVTETPLRPASTTENGVVYIGSNISVNASGVISLNNGNITGALGYTPVDRAGDTMTGTLNLPNNGLNVGTTQFVVSGGGVALGAALPHSSAALDVSSTTRGLLIPRMTTAERNLIASPHNGLQVYNVTTDRVEYWNATLASWETIATLSTTITSLNGLTSPTQTFAFGTFGTTLGVSSANGVHTFNLPLAITSGVVGGVVSNADYLTWHDKITSITATAGHLVISGAVSNPNIALATTAVTAASYGSSSTVPTFTVDAYGRLTAAASVPLRPASTAETGVVQVGANISVDNAGVISVTSGNVVAALGYTPVNRAGDVMTGALTAPEFSATNSVAIGTASAAASAILDITSTTKGVLLPRVTTVQRDAISSPAAGLTVYNLTTGSVDYYDALDSSWKRIVTSVTAITSLNGSTSSTQTFAVAQTGTEFAINTLNGVHTLSIPLASAANVTAGLLSNADYLTFHDKVTSVSGVAGQIVITGGVSSPVVGLATTAVAAASYGSSSTVGTFIVDAFGRLTSATSVPLRPASTAETGVVQVGSNITVNGSGVISLTNANITGALGYTPVDRAGDTMTGTLFVPANGFTVGTNQLVASGGGVIIGGAIADASAIFDVSSTTRGALLPRMTLAQRNAIASPVDGLQVFNTSNNKLEFYDSGFWRTISTTSHTGVTLNGISLPDQFFATGYAGTSFSITSVGNTHTFNIPNAITTGVTDGLVSNSDYLTWHNRLASITTTAGHLVITGPVSSPNIALPSTGVTAASYGSSSTVGTFSVDAQGRLTSATSVALRVASTAETGVVQVGTNISVNASGLISVTSGNIVAALGYTPVDRAGDTMTGTLFVPANGFTVGTNQLVASGGGVIIGGAVPNAAAALDVSSTAKGFLIPRLTLAERNSITSPVDGLQVYNTTNSKFEFYESGFWRTISTTSATGVTINGLNPPDQFLVTGSAGTSFTISSSGNTHTFNIPNAITTGVTDGLVANSDYVSWHNRLASITTTAGHLVITGPVSSPNIALPSTGVAAASYGTSSTVGTFSVDAQGRVTSAASVALRVASTSENGVVQVGSNITVTAGTISVTSANVIAAMGQLGGDVSGTLDNTVVMTVGGRTAAQIASSVAETLAATHLNSSGTIVKRDPNGDFTANNITTVQDMTVQRNLRIQNGSSNYIGITTPIATPSYDVILPPNNTPPQVGQALAVFSATPTLVATTWVDVIDGTLASGSIIVGGTSGSAIKVPMTGDGSMTAAGALVLAQTGVTSASYGGVNAIPVLQIDGKGRITSATTVTYQDTTAAQKGIVQVGSNISVAGGVISLTRANITSALDFTPVNIAGDVMTGALTAPTLTASNSIAIGTASAAAVAALDIVSTTKGILIPRMTTAQRDLIGSPVDGLTIYNLTTAALEYYDTNAPAGWKRVVTDYTAITSLNGLTSPSQTFAFGTFGSTLGVSSTGSVHTFNLPLAVTAGVVAGVVSNDDYLTWHNRVSSITVTAGHLVITGPVSQPNLALASTNISTGTYGSSSTAGIFTVDTYGRLTSASSVPFRPASTAETGVVIVGNNISVSSTGAISLNRSNITTALGYTPVNIAGDVMTGDLTVPSLSATRIGIGTASAAASAILDITSTTSGVLMPRMTTAQRNAIPSPANGLQVYNTTNNSLDIYDGVASTWKSLITASGAITTLNGLTASMQTFAFGTTGTTLNVSSIGSVHTFNLPLANTVGVNAGVISNTEFQSFHDKVTSVSAAAGQIVITGGVSTPVVGLANTTVAAGTYGTANAIPIITVDQFGRITSTATQAYQDATNVDKGIVQIGNNITVTGGVISLNKQNVSSALSYIPVNSQGDTMSGTLVLPTNGLVVGGVGGSQLVANSSGVGIGTATNHASALLDLTATNKGFLMPRMTLAQRNALTATAANGLQIFNSDSNKVEFYDSGFWRTISTTSSTGVSLNGLTPPDQFLVTGTAGTSFGIVSTSDTHTFNIPMAITTGVTAGLVANTDYLSWHDRVASITVTAGHLVITGAVSQPNLALASTNITTGTYGSSSTAGIFTVDTYGRLTSASSVPFRPASTAETGVVIVGNNISVSSTGAISLNRSNITTALGYTPVNIAGDVMTGDLTVPSLSATRIGIGTASAAVSSILDITSTTSGVLLPRMTTVQRDAIPSPVDGLHIYNTSNKFFEYWDGGTSSWKTMATTSAAVVSLNGLTNPFQTFAFGTFGSTLGVSSTGSVHTFNLPQAVTTGVTAGTVANSDYLSWHNRIASITVTAGHLVITGAVSQPNLALASTNITTGTYGSSSTAGIFTVDTYGRLTSASSVPFRPASTAETGVVTIGNNISVSSTGAISLVRGNITGALGFTPVNIAGDVMTGDLTVPSLSATRIAIGSTSAAASAILEITSTTSGILIPRMTSTERNAIPSPANGLQVYNTSNNSLDFYDSGSSTWKSLITASGAITTMNGLTASMQTFAFGTFGSTLGVSSTGSVHTFNLPNAITTGVTGGVISNSDYLSWHNRIASITVSAGHLVITGAVSQPNLALASTNITTGTYGSSSTAGIFTVDTYGRLTSASSVPFRPASTAETGVVTIGNNISVSSTGAISLVRGNITGALGFTPVNIAGDVMTGDLTVPSLSATRIAIGSTSAAASAILDITSTTSGVLMPRMTIAQRNLIPSPANGLQVYNTTNNSLDFYDSGSSTWKSLITASGTVTTLNGLTASMQTFALGTFGTTLGVSSTGSVHTINLPNAITTGVTGGVVSNDDYVSWHNRIASITVTAGHLVITGAVSQPNLALATTTVTAASYGSSSTVPTYTVDAYGRLTAAANVSLRPADTTWTGVVQIGDNISVSSTGRISITANNVASAAGLQLARTFYAANAGPTATSNYPSFRYIASSDLPTSGTTGVWLNGGNSFGTTTIFGTKDTQPIEIQTNAVARMRMDTSGGVSFTGQVNAGVNALGTNSTTPIAVDANSGNTITLTTNAGSIASQTLNLSNVKPGATYSVVVTRNDANDVSMITINCNGAASRYIPSNGARSASGGAGKTIYTFIYDGTECLITWITGF